MAMETKPEEALEAESPLEQGEEQMPHISDQPKDGNGEKPKRFITRHERIKKPMSREEARKRVEEMELEKGDVPAMILAAFITFGPILLALMGIVIFVAWFLTRAG